MKENVQEHLLYPACSQKFFLLCVFLCSSSMVFSHNFAYPQQLLQMNSFFELLELLLHVHKVDPSKL